MSKSVAPAPDVSVADGFAHFKLSKVDTVACADALALKGASLSRAIRAASNPGVQAALGNELHTVQRLENLFRSLTLDL